MFRIKLLCLVFLLLNIHSDCYSFDDYQEKTGMILDLLNNKDSNKHLIHTVVDCMGKTYTSNGKSSDFLRCVNDLMHTDDSTNTDDIRYIIGNYAARASKLLIKCYYKHNDLIYCLRAFGDCLPLLFRGLHGYNVHNRSCKRLMMLPYYDKNIDYLTDEDRDYDDYDDDYDDGYDGYDDYDEYDYEDGYDDYDYDEDEDMDTDEEARSERKRHRRSSGSSTASQKSTSSHKSNGSHRSNASNGSKTSEHFNKVDQSGENRGSNESLRSTDSGDSFEVIEEPPTTLGTQIAFNEYIVNQVVEN